MKLSNLRDLYMYELNDLYSAESQLIEALPQWEQKATSRGLKQALREHLKETRDQHKRPEHIFEDLGEKPKNSEAGVEEVRQYAILTTH